MAITALTTTTKVNTLRNLFIKAVQALEAQLLVRNPALLPEANAAVAAALTNVSAEGFSSSTVAVVTNTQEVTLSAGANSGKTLTLTVANGVITGAVLSDAEEEE